MRRSTLAVLALMALPALAAGQRGGGSRTGATTRDNMFSDDPSTRRQSDITSNKLRDLNPLAILIDKHKDMSLSDDQVNKLKSMNDSLDAAQKQAYQMLDSLNQQIRNVGSGGGQDDQSRLQTMNSFVRMIAGNVRQRYDSASTAAMSLLTDDQKKKADDVLKDSRNELQRIAGRGRSD